MNAGTKNIRAKARFWLTTTDWQNMKSKHSRSRQDRILNQNKHFAESEVIFRWWSQLRFEDSFTSRGGDAKNLLGDNLRVALDATFFLRGTRASRKFDKLVKGRRVISIYYIYTEARAID